MVVYQGEPVQIRKEHAYRDEKKYVKDTFGQRGHAELLAAKMNRLFGTDDFKVARIQAKNTS